MGKSIVDIQNMGDALRNTGYKNIESAVSEIVDNSVEALAKNIFIIISEQLNVKSGRKLVSEIGFLDNGIGMGETILASCLGLGVTTRTARTGMGRFGVGLPQASLYACPEVEVYSWQDGIGNCKKVFLDINKIKEGIQKEIEDPIGCTIPEKYLKYIQYRTVKESFDFSINGTLVLWKNCDRIQPRTRGPLSQRLEFALGQKFRYFINSDECNIKIICDENQEMAANVMPNDPLFLMTNNYVLGNPENPGKAYIKQKEKGLEPFFEPFTNDKVKNGEVIKEIYYYDKQGEVKSSPVTIRFSIIKDKFYDETAFKKGTQPGNYEFGKLYASKMEGISIVRANREIDFRKFDFYKNINEPQHRWWGCEIIFNPELDEAFGVANNKQYVELKRVEKEDIDQEEEVQPVWYQLSDIVSNTIDAMYKKNEETRKKTRTYDYLQTASVDIINKVEKDNDIESESKDVKERMPEDERIDKGKEVLAEQGIEPITEEDVKRYINNAVNFTYLDRGKFCPAFDFSSSLGCIIININIGHDFYTSFLKKIYDNSDVVVTFELFIASFVKSIDETNKFQRDQNDWLLGTWHEKLRRYIMQQLNPPVK